MSEESYKKKKEHVEDSQEELIKEQDFSLDQHTGDFEEEFTKKLDFLDQHTNISELKNILG